MVTKTLLVGALIGGIAYVLLKTQRQVANERHLQRKEHSRWEDEGGAAIPHDVSHSGGAVAASV